MLTRKTKQILCNFLPFPTEITSAPHYKQAFTKLTFLQHIVLSLKLSSPFQKYFYSRCGSFEVISGKLNHSLLTLLWNNDSEYPFFHFNPVILLWPLTCKTIVSVIVLTFFWHFTFSAKTFLKKFHYFHIYWFTTSISPEIL